MNNLFFVTKNWEQDIHNVEIEVSGDDPLGYKAVFFLSEETPKPISFSVGASTLVNRAKGLALAGYKAPMTQKAIALVESRLGGSIAHCGAC